MRSKLAVWSFVIGLISLGYSIIYLLSLLEIVAILPFQFYIESRLVLILLLPIIFSRWLFPIGIILGIVGLTKMSKDKKLEGKGLAVLGIVLNSAAILLLFLTFGG